MTWWCLSIVLAQPDMTVVGSLRQLNTMFGGVSFGDEATISSVNCPTHYLLIFVIILHSIRFKCINFAPLGKLVNMTERVTILLYA